MTIRRHVHEAGTLLLEAKSGSDTYPVRIITEGVGSSGVYSRELLEKHKDAFTAAPSFLDHPVDPNKPWERSVKNIGGRLVGSVEAREVDGVLGLYTEYKPRAEYRAFVEEFADILGLSIYIGSEGYEEGGKYVVESFDATDPYRSVDIVVAAGRGGRFEKAQESYRAIESSLGLAPEDNGTSTEESRQTERNTSMEIEELAKKVDTLVESVTELATAHATLAESLKPADKPEVDFEAAVEAVIEANLPKASRTVVLESITAGNYEDVLKAQKELVAAVRESLTPAPSTVGAGRVVEGKTEGFSLTALKGA